MNVVKKPLSGKRIKDKYRKKLGYPKRTQSKEIAQRYRINRILKELGRYREE